MHLSAVIVLLASDTKYALFVCRVPLYDSSVHDYAIFHYHIWPNHHRLFDDAVRQLSSDNLVLQTYSLSALGALVLLWQRVVLQGLLRMDETPEDTAQVRRVSPRNRRYPRAAVQNLLTLLIS